MKTRLEFNAVDAVVESPSREKQSRGVSPDGARQTNVTVRLIVDTVADPDGPLVFQTVVEAVSADDGLDSNRA